MIISGWLAGGSNNGQIARLEWLVEVPGLDVLAMTSISGISQGVFQGIPGAAAATVTEYGIVSSPLPQDIPDDPVNNAFYNYGCSYIRFRLTVVQANAYSHAAAFPLNPASFKKIDVGTKAFSIRSKDSGDLLAAYRISLLDFGSQINEEEHLERALKRLSNEVGCHRREFLVDRIEDNAKISYWKLFKTDSKP